MIIVDDYVEVPPFEVFEPAAARVPFVFNAPHSGLAYPRDLLRRTRLDRMVLRRSEDTFVDELFAAMPALGAPLMRANFPRVYVDVNREADEIDASMFTGPVDAQVNHESPRVAGGLGVIARIVGERQEIYAERLPSGEAERRLERFYKPYHARLAALVEATVTRFGTCVLVDCHSMPSGAVKAAQEKGGPRPDVILGDRFAKSASPRIADKLTALFAVHGLVVGRNRPYAGGYITEHHGRPPAVHAVQLEINRALYMDETSYRKSAGFTQLRATLDDVMGDLVAWFTARAADEPWSMAAE